MTSNVPPSPPGRMHVREWGSPDGRPLVFWHALGSGTSGAYLTEIAPTLTDAGLWLLAPDAPGFGESPALPSEEYETASVVGMVRDLLDARGIDRAILMGHSWGGTIMTAFAAAHPACRRAGAGRQRADRLPGRARFPAREDLRGPCRGRAGSRARSNRGGVGHRPRASLIRPWGLQPPPRFDRNERRHTCLCRKSAESVEVCHHPAPRIEACGRRPTSAKASCASSRRRAIHGCPLRR